MIGFQICKRTRKVSADIVAKFRELPVANISDSMSRMTAAGAKLLSKAPYEWELR